MGRPPKLLVISPNSRSSPPPARTSTTPAPPGTCAPWPQPSQAGAGGVIVCAGRRGPARPRGLLPNTPVCFSQAARRGGAANSVKYIARWWGHCGALCCGTRPRGFWYTQNRRPRAAAESCEIAMRGLGYGPRIGWSATSFRLT